MWIRYIFWSIATEKFYSFILCAAKIVLRRQRERESSSSRYYCYHHSSFDDEITFKNFSEQQSVIVTQQHTTAKTLTKWIEISFFLSFTVISSFSDGMRHKVGHSRQYQSKHHHEHHLGPFFEGPLNTTAGTLNVGVHLYTEAVLNCRVGMLKDKTVSFFAHFSSHFHRLHRLFSYISSCSMRVSVFYLYFSSDFWFVFFFAESLLSVPEIAKFYLLPLFV